VKKISRAVIAAVVFSCLLKLSGCAKDINYIVDHEPSVRGMVTETATEYIMIDVNAADDLYGSYSSIKVSLDTERKDSMTHFKVGDEVAVYYNGSIAESDPAQINKVYAILYLGSTD